MMKTVSMSQYIWTWLYVSYQLCRFWSAPWWGSASRRLERRTWWRWSLRLSLYLQHTEAKSWSSSDATTYIGVMLTVHRSTKKGIHFRVKICKRRLLKHDVNLLYFTQKSGLWILFPTLRVILIDQIISCHEWEMFWCTGTENEQKNSSQMKFLSIIPSHVSNQI